MDPLTSEGVLRAAERLHREPPARRGAAIVAATSGIDLRQAMALPIGERDDQLLALRAATFGPELRGVIDCSACGERCEVTLDIDGLRHPERSEGPVRAGGAPPVPPDPSLALGMMTVDVEAGGWRVRARLPNSADAADAARQPTVELARRALLERCILERDVDGEMPEEVAAAIEAAMERADPRAAIELDVACPACGAQWSTPFDIVSFLSSEIAIAAERLALDVHDLARAYGWPEADILAMSHWRRQLYLDLVNGE